VGVITKSHLVTRDIDLLAGLAQHGAAAVMLSVTTLDRDLQLRLEPRAATPARRLGAIRMLAEAGIPVGVNVAPVIPGLTDHEVPAILDAAAEAGASFAGMIVLRLPGVVKEIFEGWLRENVPDRADKVLNRVRQLRGGELYDARFGARGRGTGPWAEQFRSLFKVQTERLGLGRSPKLSAESFKVPGSAGESQTDLFAQAVSGIRGG
jgi:DNA repair photolyase